MCYSSQHFTSRISWGVLWSKRHPLAGYVELKAGVFSVMKVDFNLAASPTDHCWINSLDDALNDRTLWQILCWRNVSYMQAAEPHLHWSRAVQVNSVHHTVTWLGPSIKTVVHFSHHFCWNIDVKSLKLISLCFGHKRVISTSSLGSVRHEHCVPKIY